MKNKYSLTKKACYLGYIVQASVNNLMPLLFVLFEQSYKIPLYLISIIVTYNFVLQILIDSVSAKITLKLGYRKTAYLALSLASLGLVVAGVTPLIFSNYIVIYIGIMLATTFMAIGGGITEVVLSPLVEAVSDDGEKSSGMNFLHSFYCVGHMGVVLLATLFFTLFKIENWSYFAFLVALVPLIDMILFAKCEIKSPKGDHKPVKIKSLFKNSTFILVMIMMVCAGACEMAIAQWVSYFAEVGLKVDKSVGDILGVCIFAFCMFSSRLYFGVSQKRQVTLKVLIAFSITLTACFILSKVLPIPLLSLIALSFGGFFVGVMWPGIYAIAGKILSSGGTTMYSMLALGGDLGCALGPFIVGYISEFSNVGYGMLSGTIFSITMIIACTVLKRKLLRKN